MIRACLFAALLLASTGCSRTNISELIKAAGTDPATVCWSGNLMTPWGSEVGSLARTNLTNGTVTCSKDGLTIKSDASSIGVPMTITPQFSIGQPTVEPAK